MIIDQLVINEIVINKKVEGYARKLTPCRNESSNSIATTPRSSP